MALLFKRTREFLTVACIFQLLTVGPLGHTQTATPEVDFGVIGIGSASAPSVVTLVLTAGGKLERVSLMTLGLGGSDFNNFGTGTCTIGASYEAGANCTVVARFAPEFAGTRHGAVVLETGSGQVMAVSGVRGTGVGTQASSPAGVGNAKQDRTQPTRRATVPLTGTSSLVTSSVTCTTPPVNASSSAGTCTSLSSGVHQFGMMLVTNFGPVNGGSSSSGTSTTLTFETSGTLGSVAIVTQGASGLDFASAGGGTCAVGTNYNAGDSCTVNVTFTPKQAGSRYGAAVGRDSSGNVLTTSYLQGTGVEPQVNFLPATESPILGSTLSNPFGVAVDGAGNVYIADSGNNRVLKETYSAGSYVESTVPTSALSYPTGIAVDGAGNLYIADTGNNRVLLETLSSGGYSEATVSTSALSYPGAVAVDGSGNVYIADTGNNRVLLETLSSGSYTESIVSTSTLNAPSGVAVDGGGNIYIADSANNRVLLETLSSGGYTESTVTSSTLSYPGAVAVDGSGNIYIADTYNNRVLKETLSSGSYAESAVSTSALNGPSGIAVAGSGNVYIADTYNNRVLKEDLADPPSLSFVPTAPGATSSDSPQIVTVENAGNATLNFPVPSSGNNPSISTYFTLNSSGTSACPLMSAGASAAGNLAAGQSCQLPISFAPTEAGVYSGSIVLNDDALNAAAPGYASQTIPLSGTGTGSTSQSISFGTISAQTANSALALTATASSGLPISFTSTTPASCTVSGSTASLVTAGTCTIQASQAGNTSYKAATPVTQSFTVNLAAQTVTFATIPTQIINTAIPATLSASASSGLPVSFASTTPTVCTVSASAATASLLVNGTCTIQASQTGDGVVYAAAPTVTQSFTVQSANPVTSTSFGTVNIGSTGSPVTVTLNFNTAATLGSVSVLTQGASGLDFAGVSGGTCAVGTSYAAAASCTVSVTFAPTLAGSRNGAVVLADSSRNVLATAYLQGTGNGPQVEFLPGAESAIPNSVLNGPGGVAVDGNGNVYIADTGNNRVLKEVLSAGNYTESTVSTSALSLPLGIAVDGAGNLYIADSGNNRVLVERPSAGSYVESVVPASTLSSPSGVAVDGSGNVYIADSGNNRVLREIPVAGTYIESLVPTSALSVPLGVAVDGSGNLYIVDSYNNRVLLETLTSGTYTESAVTTSSLNYPSAVAVDDGGNVYVADTYNNRVLKEAVLAGSYTESTVSTSALNGPSAIAVAGNANVYIADASNNRALKEDLADPPSLNFASTAPGATSSDSPQAVTLENTGNATLTFPVPGSGSNPNIAANFTLNSSGASACPVVSAGASAAATLVAGQSCLLPIAFAPTGPGTFGGVLALTDNALNATAPGYVAQSIQLSGVGTGSTSQTINFGTIPTQAAGSTLTLMATASSGLPVGFMSTTPAVCMVSGATASSIAVGTCTIQASQAGSPVYAAAPTVTESFMVNLAAQTITFATIPTQVINTAVPVTLIATASSGLPVSFVSTTPTICTVSDSTSTATLVTAGTCTIQASQAGDGVGYAAAPTVTQGFTVQSVNPLTSTSFGMVNIGSTGLPVTVTMNFNTAATLASLTVLTQGASGLDFANAGTGSCAAGTSYAAAANCTVNVTFTPAQAGSRDGAVVLADAAGNVLAAAYLQGTGMGPQVEFSPGIETTVGISTLSFPFGIAVDGSGTIYVTDTGNNRVAKETYSAGNYAVSIVPTSKLVSPSGIAVDGSGNVYVVDTGSNRVLKETYSSGTYSETVVPTSTLSFPGAVAADGSGNVYIADSGNNRVLLETLTSSGYNESILPTSSLGDPSGVAVDGSGNVYIADTDNNRIVVETLASGKYTESTVPTSSLSNPFGVAVDGIGNLYIADSYNNRVLMETLSSGIYTESVVPTSAVNAPYAIAVADNGNVYVADTYNSRVLKEDLADPPSLSFALTVPGSTSSDSPQTVTVENVGNVALSFPVPGSGNNPSLTGSFALNSSGASGCTIVNASSSAPGTLPVGRSCLLPISFTPTTAGPISGSLALTDNSLNTAATQSIQLSGSGIGSTSQTISFATIPAQPANSALSLTATASSGLPVSFTSTTPVICTVSGSIASLLAAGTCTIQAGQTGSTVYAAASPVTQSFAVNLLAQTVTFPAIPDQVLDASQSIPLLATASSGLAVNYASSTPAVCTASTPNATATLLSAGTCTIQASQPGDGMVYASASTITQSFTVLPPGVLTNTSLGSVNVGSASSVTAVTLTFNTVATVSSISVVSQGTSGLDFANSGTGSCTTGTTYSSGASCTVSVVFTPKFVGIRYGAVVLADGSGNPLATSYLHGTGVGPQVNFLPGSESTLSTSALNGPSGVAVDANGNIYISDENNGRVLKETLSVGSYTEMALPTSTLNAPQGIAVDGSGSVYIADSGNNRVLKETLAAGSYTESALPTSTLNAPQGIAVDGSGNVYIADTSNNRVLKEVLASGSYIESTLSTSALNGPSGVAVDATGNVYIVDENNSRVLKEAYSSGTYIEALVPTSTLNSPSRIAVDGSGDVYVADSGNNRVLLETLTSTGYIESTVQANASDYPYGVAVDASGNVYIADLDNNNVSKVDVADPPSLSFAPTAPNSTSGDSPQIVTIKNVGSAGLTFSSPTSGSNPSLTGSFTLNSSGTSVCPLLSVGSAAVTLTAGQSCLLPISFTPSTSGVSSGSLTVTDNTLNVVTAQTIQLSGTGTGSSQQTIIFGTIPPQSIDSTLALTVTASSGLAVNLVSITPTICTFYSPFNITMASAGTCTLQASQAGNAVYAAAPTITQSFTVNLYSQTITFPAMATQIINTSTPLAPQASTDSGLPVSYTSATPSICTAVGSTVMLLTVGTCTIQANQAGNNLYAPALAVTQSFLVESISLATNVNFGAVNIGSASSPNAVSLTFSTAGTLGSISALTGGVSGLDFANAGTGSCATGTSYGAGASCTVNITFTPTLSGSRFGAVVLYGGSGNVLATGYMQGNGVGPQITFMPNADSTIPTSTLSGPSGVAVDGSGNIYIADTYNQRVLKETLSAGNYTESIVPTSPLSYPYGIAVDGSGSVYVADTGDNRVLKETPSLGSYTESTVQSSPLNNPFGVAVDGSGNVYIADTYNSRVLLETPSSGSYVESALTTSALNSPFGIAVDGSGNIYIADSYNSRVLKEIPGESGYREIALPTTAVGPFGITVDGVGDVYISNYFVSGNGDTSSDLLKEKFSSGTYTESTIQTSTLSAPFGVAVDGMGNVYLADTSNNRVLKEDFADSPSLSFALTAPGAISSDSPQTVTVQNTGNGLLTFPAVSGASNPSITSNFTLNTLGAGVCPVESVGSSTSGTLAAGQSCLLPIAFAPTATGTFSGSLALKDNTLNAAAPGYAIQAIVLSGTGTGSSPQTITFGSIPAQYINSTLALSATASSGLAVNFISTTPAICTVAGTNASLVAAGVCTIQANQGGSTVYAAAPSVTQSFVVNLLTQTITFAAIPSQVLNTTVGVPLSASASSGRMVSFTSTTPAICSVALVLNTYPNAFPVNGGTCTIQASQAGDGVTYAAALPVTQSFAIQTVTPSVATNFGAINIGSTGSPTSVTLTFNTAATLGSISVLTRGATGLDFADTGTGSCSAGASYGAGDTCTESVTFTPTVAGNRFGAVTLADGSGVVLATAYLAGKGIGPQMNFAPGTESILGSGATPTAAGIAVDGSGNIYVADSGNGVVWKETPSSGSYTQSVLPTSSLSSPQGVAVDGAGNVYIADTNNNRVLKETPSSDGYSESTVPTSALNSPKGVAVDGSGNLYIADTYNYRVLMEAPSAGSYTETLLPTSPLQQATGVAADGSGNVYIADLIGQRVLKETLSAGGYTESTLPFSGFTYPSAVAVDGIGNVYLAQWGFRNRGPASVLKLTPSGSSYVQSTVASSALADPSGVAVDQNGNVFISDTDNHRVLREDLADPPSLTFTLTAPGTVSSDSPQAVTVKNIGNAALTFPIPGSGSNPSITANFSLSSGGTLVCPLQSPGSSAVGTLAAGQSCLLPVNFVPTAAGTSSGSLVLTDNALNATAPGYAAQSIQLTGTGTGSTTQTITFGSISSQPIGSSVALTATASSGLTVSFTSTTPAICSLYSSSNLSLTAAGTCSIQANQTGSTTYAAAPTATQSFAVTLISQTITFGPIAIQAINTSAPVTLVATASSGNPVTFTSNTPAICTVSGSTATLLADGSCTILADQPGDGVRYAAAPTVTQTFTVASANPLLAASFGSVNIGSSSSAIAVSATFTSAATLGSVSVQTQGASGLDFSNAGTGTCALGTGYNVGDSCTVTATFTPLQSGSRYGAVMLADGSGNVVATAYLQGIGEGPQLDFLPGTESVVTASAWGPAGVAVDASGNVYVVARYGGQILKETLSSGTYTETPLPTSALNNPQGIAVDGGGSIYIADTGNNRVLKETPSGETYTESIVPTSSLNGPEAVAVDANGTVYIADSGNRQVLMEVLTGGSYVESRVPSSAGSPSNVAVDGNGNVYIVNSGSNNVLKETLSAGSYTESALPINSQGSLLDLAVDGNGNVYFSQSAAGRYNLVMLAPFGGRYIQNTIPTSSLELPSGLAVDGRGNVYVADFYRQQVLKEDLTDPPSVNFVSTVAGSTSSDSPQNVTVENLGNAALSIPIPGSGQNPSIPTNFTLDILYPFSCVVVNNGASTAATLAAGQPCLLSISFAPTLAGTFNSSLVLTDNALNAAAPGYTTQSIQLNGTATASPAAVPTYSIASGTYTSAQTVSISDATSGATIYYTIDGTTPTTASTVYSAPITVSATETLEAIAVATGYSTSAAGTAAYTITLPAATPTFSPSPGTYTTAQTITISDSTSGAIIYYTTDGTTPTSSSPVYSSPVTVSATGSLEAIANAAGYSNSAIGTAAYTIGTQPLTIPAAGLIGTVAGNGTQGYAGDGGQAASAELNAPRGMVVDSAGNIYFADTGNNAIRKITAATGVIRTVAGNGTQGYSGDGGSATGAELDSPAGVAVDPGGNLYIADMANNAIRKVTASTGVITTVAGAPDDYWGGYSGDGGPATAATFADPKGVALDSAGNIYIADMFNNAIRKVTISTGIITTVAGNGSSGYSGDSGLATAAELNWPTDVAVDSAGNIYIADSGNVVIREIAASTGAIATVAGNGTAGYAGDGGASTSANLGDPVNLAVDAAGNIYISDSGFDVIRKVTASTGIISTVAGVGGYGYSGDGGPATNAELNLPAGLAIAPAGNFYLTNNLFIADSGNNVIRAVGGYRTAAPIFSPVPATYSAAQTVTISTSISGATIRYTTDGTTPTASSSIYSGPLTVSSTETLNAIAVTSTGQLSAVGTAPYTITQVTPAINFGSGFTSTNLSLVNDATIVDGALQLSDGNVGEERAAWFSTPVSAQAFTSDFNYQAVSAIADGMTFTLQNDPTGSNALGDGGGGLSYEGIESSVAIKFDLYSNIGEGTNSTGVYINGAAPELPALDLTPSGVVLRSGDLMHVHVTYDGTTLSWTITDTVTNANFSGSTAVDIPTIVGGNTAYVGFTGSTGAFASTQNVSNWTYIQ